MLAHDVFLVMVRFQENYLIIKLHFIFVSVSSRS